MDARLEREVKDWRDFLEGFKITKEVSKWALRELTSVETLKWIKIMFAWLFLATIFNVLQPYILSLVFDGLAQKEIRLVFYGLTGSAFFLAISKLTDYKQSVAREWILGLTWSELDDKITKLFFEKSVGQHLQESSFLSISNIDKGRWKVVQLQSMLLFEGIPVVLGMLFSFIALWIISWVVGVIVTLVLLMHLVWMFYLNWRVLKECIPIDKEMRKINRYRLARWENIERVKSSGKEDEELDFMKKWFDTTISRDRNFWLWFTKQRSWRDTLNIFAVVSILAYGSYLVWNGFWTIGLLYPLASWAGRLSDNIWRIGQLEHQINWNMPAVKSMIDALTLPPDIIQTENPLKISFAAENIGVEFKNVTFRYPLSSEEKEARDKCFVHTLKNVSFKIEPGEKVALIGMSGAGKTTVMRLLLRFVDPDAGEVLINGHNLKNIDQKDWMHLIGYIPQQPQVLDGTIRYNLTYGLPAGNGDVSEDDIWKIMKKLRIDFGVRLNKGIETLVGRDGLRLSGGQQQRLMIGAAAIKNPKLMIIDEATSNLDSTTEKEVQAGLAKVLSGNASALVIAHRLSTVRNICGKFIVLSNVTETFNGHPQVEATASSFEELQEISPIFRQLAKDQDLVI